MNLMQFLGLAICVVLLAGPAGAKPRVVTVAPGQTVEVGKHVSFTGDCSQGPVPLITIIDKPKYGVLGTDLGAVKMRHAKVGSSTCEGRASKGLIILYTANVGFHGVDHLQYRVDYYPKGNSYWEVDIKVK